MNNNWEYDYSGLYNNPQTGAQQPQAAPAQPDDAAQSAQQPQGGEVPPVQPQQQNVPPYQNPSFTGGPAGTPPAPKKKGMGKTGKRIAALAAAVLFCGAAGFGGGYLGYRAARGNSTAPVIYQAPPVQPQEEGAVITPSESGVTGIVKRVAPSVVEVSTEAVTTNPIFGQFIQGGAGSGVIITEDGYIITNNHVVSGASNVKVRLTDGSEHDARIIGTDPKTDIAVLKIEATGLTPAVIGDSDALEVGEFTLAVGNPLGRLGGTVTDGIVSALNRDVTVNNETMNLLQTNAAVSPGNSGGGLFNSRGELIGIVNAKSSGSDTEGLGFAIPVNTAIRVAEELMSNGYVTGRPAMGVMVQDIADPQTAYRFGVSQAGVYIREVNKGGAAEKAGLKQGDRFVSIDGTAVSGLGDITAVLGEHQVGDVVEVQVARGKQIVAVQLTLEELQPSAPQNPAQQQIAP